jgi:hypothetical protein
MEFPEQLLLAIACSIVVFYPVYFILLKKYKKQGRSIKYLMPKLFIFIGIPILAIPVLLSDIFSSLEKLLLIIVATIAGLINYHSTTTARKTFRKIMGLPPEDEHTGEVIKDDTKEK